MGQLWARNAKGVAAASIFELASQGIDNAVDIFMVVFVEMRLGFPNFRDSEYETPGGPTVRKIATIRTVAESRRDCRRGRQLDLIYAQGAKIRQECLLPAALAMALDASLLRYGSRMIDTHIFSARCACVQNVPKC